MTRRPRGGKFLCTTLSTFCGAKEPIIVTRNTILRVFIAGAIVVAAVVFALTLYNISVLAGIVWDEWDSYRRKKEAYNEQTAGLLCDGVLFSNLYGRPQPSPEFASFVGEETQAGAVGHGTLFVKIKGGSPKRFADLTVADVECIPQMLRTTDIEQGREIVRIGDSHGQFVSLYFDQDRLVSGRIDSNVDEVVFCDKTGANEFRISDHFLHIKRAIGPNNYKERFPNSDW